MVPIVSDNLVVYSADVDGKQLYAGLSMGHICLSHSHPIAIYTCPSSSHPMGRFPWDSHRNDILMDKPDYTRTC